MPQAEKNQRLYPRMSSAVSVKLQYLHDAKAINISEKGICLETFGRVDENQRNILSFQMNQKNVEAEFEVIWRDEREVTDSSGEKKIINRYGFSLKHLSEKHLDRLLDSPFELKKIDPDFIRLAKKFRKKLREILTLCDNFDLRNQGGAATQIEYIGKNKKKFFRILNKYFKKAWKILGSLTSDQYREYQNYFRFVLGHYLEIPAINRHICSQPLGYPGDFMIMNYIYEYQKDNYLGKNTYEKIINHYTCNIPVALSNIVRKDFIKSEILSLVSKKREARILSLGGGPARELLEILKENWRGYAFNFTYLDFEKKAMEYVKKEISNLYERPSGVMIDYFLTDIIHFIKQKNLGEKLGEFDYIYISGLFDYFNDKLCAHVLSGIIRLLRPSGKILVCNISNKNVYQRAYYETFGKWKMFHREASDLIGWTKNMQDGVKTELLKIKKCPNYHFMEIKNK